MPFRLSRAAEADLLSIYQYSFDMFGPAQAEAYQDRIEQTINLVGENPQLARLMQMVLPISCAYGTSGKTGSRILTKPSHPVSVPSFRG